MDTYRFSLANLEDSQDIELDAILGELCALESHFDQELICRGHARSVSTVITGENLRCSALSIPDGHSSSLCDSHSSSTMALGPKRFFGHRRSNSGGTKSKMEISNNLDYDDQLRSQKVDLGVRTDSPDNDSAFSDCVSMLSSESSVSSSGRTDTGISSQGSSKTNSIVLVPSPTQLLDSISRRLQALQIEVEKENSPPIFIKAFTADDSAKSLLVDERMTVGEVCRLLADKNHVPMDPRWTLIEYIPELFMERMYEDHEYIVENLLLWVRDSPNKLQYLEKDDKYDLFIKPEEYLLLGSSSEKGVDLDDDAKMSIIEEFFSASAVPEVESALYLKSDGKKVWKKHYFVLRASGIYYCPKGRSKLSKDLICLTTFEMNNVYYGFGWKKKYKAPTDFGFAVKHPQIQTKSSKYIKYLCAEDEKTLKQWITGIRIAKYGSILKTNYDNLMRDIVEEDLETLAHARSFSVSSMAKTMAVSSDSSGSSGSPDRQDISLEDVVFSGPHTSVTPEQGDHDLLSNRSSESTPTPTPLEWGNPQGVMMRHDSVKSSSSSSGCLSERSTPTIEHPPFDIDVAPNLNTLKRKPSMTPKIPLTNTTRLIAKQSDDSISLDNTGPDKLVHSNSSAGYSVLAKTLNRRFCLRRSQTEDQITFSEASRLLQRNSVPDIPGLPPKKRGNIDDVKEFPLPPPPLSAYSSIESLDIALLPPPPPEAFRGSTTSLDSLPPPPPPLNLSDECSWPSTSSLNSLPPPPSPEKTSNEGVPNISPIHLHAVRGAHFNKQTGRRMSEADVMSHPPPPFLAELKLGVRSLSRSFTKTNQKPRINDDRLSLSSGKDSQPVAHFETKSDRRASMPAVPMTLNVMPHVPSLNARTSSPQPLPPARSSSTLPLKRVREQGAEDSFSEFNSSTFLKRTQKPEDPLANNASPGYCPPESFLRDLQRVMMKKWKVAQQLSIDVDSSPNEILGFRDPCYLPPANKAMTLGPPPPPPPPPPHTIHFRSSQSKHEKHSVENTQTPKKKPPPPPPKRSETTQLSHR